MVSSTRSTGSAGTVSTSSARDHEQPFCADGDRGERAVARARAATASSNVVDLVQRDQLVLVAEQDVDLVGDERAEVVAVAVDAERVD